MKKLAIVILAVFTTSAFAMGPGGHKGADKMVEHMSQKLDLSDEQSDQLETILKTQGEKMKALHEETQGKIDAILTPEQKAKADKMREERKARWEERREKWQERKADRGE